jgi:hypothetical protein
MRRILQAGALGALVASCLAAQWQNYRDPQTPRTRDGKPNLAAPAPRLNGRPDLSGVWQAERTSVPELARVLGDEFNAVQIDPQDFTKEVIDAFWGLKPEQVPVTPEGTAAQKRLEATPDQWPHTQCLPAGLPADLFVLSFKIFQMSREIVMAAEIGSPVRQIYTDGRALPADPDPPYMGYSTGKWEGDTLVVETAGFRDGWLDSAGHPRSERMRMTERYRRRDFGHIDVEFTFNDPKYYTRSISLKAAMRLLPDSDLIEYVCDENEKDRSHLK